MNYPRFPEEGSVIGICAPSAGVGSKEESFDRSLELLNECGFEIYETGSVRNDGCPSAPPDVRGDEFNSLFADDDISMVLCASGGDFNMEMLPYIDQDLIRACPKWFAGYSDPTCIEMLLTTVLDTASIYGVNAGAWDSVYLHEYQVNALRVMTGDIPVQESYDAYASQGFDEEAGMYIMDTPVEWVLLYPDGGELFEGDNLDVTGRLIGGCIDVIDTLIGTPYEDLQGFVQRYQSDGFIWFFDNYSMDPLRLFYAMLRFRQMGLFENARAVVFGRVCFSGEATDLDYLEMLESIFGDMDIPVIWNADIGHTKPSMTLINGSMGHLRMENGQAELTMELI